MDKAPIPKRFRFFFAKRFGMKLKILIPFTIFLVGVLGLSWAFFIKGSSEAVLSSADILAEAAVDRIARDLSAPIDKAATAVRVNAAFVRSDSYGGQSAFTLAPILLSQMEDLEEINLLRIGFADGEYVEARRLDNGEIQVGFAGKDSSGFLMLYKADEPNMASQASVYDPRLQAWYTDAAARGGFGISDPCLDPSGNRTDLTISTVVNGREGALRAVISASLSSSVLVAAIDRQKRLSGAYIVVTDECGNQIIRLFQKSFYETTALSSAEGASAALPLNTLIWAEIAAFSEAGGGSRRSRLSDGSRWCLSGAYFPIIDRSAWNVTVALPEDNFLNSYEQIIPIVGLGHVAVLIAFFSMAYGMIAGIVKPLSSLAQSTERLRQNPVSLDDSAGEDGGMEYLIELTERKDELGELAAAFMDLRVSLSTNFKQLRRSLAEKDVLLKEVHHRVKNNLQIVASLLSLRAGEAEGPFHLILEELRDRVYAMAMVHQTIYTSGDFVAVPMDAYLERIIKTLSIFENASGNIILRISGGGVKLSLDKAIPCALIMVELVTNAYKHAFEPLDRGLVSVSLAREGDAYILKVSDNGKGYAAALDENRKPGAGIQIMEALASQLGGFIEYQPLDPGTEVSLRFPVGAPK